MIKRQTTINRIFKVSGIGLHSGKEVTLEFLPRREFGVAFVYKGQLIPARYDMVGDTRLSTQIGRDDVSVSTIEHLMAALYFSGITNCLVYIDGPEVPILDGSASSFVYLLQSAGIELQRTPKRFIRVTSPVEVRQGQGEALKWARLEPYHGYKLRFEIDFQHPAVDSTGQSAEFDLSTGSYTRDIARARTFGFTKDVEMLRANGLALGGSLDNVVVMDDYKVLNSEGLRYDDEFAKHKILDAMGDLYLLGKPLLASYTAFRSGHALNNLLLRELLAQTQSWQEVSFDDEKQAPQGFAQLARAWSACCCSAPPCCCC